MPLFLASSLPCHFEPSPGLKEQAANWRRTHVTSNPSRNQPQLLSLTSWNKSFVYPSVRGKQRLGFWLLIGSPDAASQRGLALLCLQSTRDLLRHLCRCLRSPDGATKPVSSLNEPSVIVCLLCCFIALRMSSRVTSRSLKVANTAFMLPAAK